MRGRHLPLWALEQDLFHVALAVDQAQQRVELGARAGSSGALENGSEIRKKLFHTVPLVRAASGLEEHDGRGERRAVRQGKRNFRLVEMESCKRPGQDLSQDVEYLGLDGGVDVLPFEDLHLQDLLTQVRFAHGRAREHGLKLILSDQAQPDEVAPHPSRPVPSARVDEVTF